MKKLVVVFLCFFASNAFASSADSGRCPWKIPFTITIHGVGSTHSYEDSRRPVTGGYYDHDTDYGIQPSSEDLSIEVDTIPDTLAYPLKYYDNSIQYSLIGDVLRFSSAIRFKVTNDSELPPDKSTSLIIQFAPGADSIISLSYSEVDSIPINNVYGVVQIGVNSFRISSLRFDDTSIFTTDSSLISHNIGMAEHDISGYDRGQYDFDYNYSDFIASSVTLSGIFRPTTFSDPPSIVTEAPQPNNLAVYSSNGSIACSFDVSDYARDLEIFSPLGIREASSIIQAGQTEASLPHLPVGFYFVRLEGELAKIYIAP